MPNASQLPVRMSSSSTPYNSSVNLLLKNESQISLLEKVIVRKDDLLPFIPINCTKQVYGTEETNEPTPYIKDFILLKRGVLI